MRVHRKRQHGVNDFNFFAGEIVTFLANDGNSATVGVVTSVEYLSEEVRISYEIIGSNSQNPRAEIGKCCILTLRKPKESKANVTENR